MFLKLRIFFTVLAALCLVAILPVTMWLGGAWFAIFAFGTLFFFALMLLCKQEQEKREKEQEEKPTGDFLHPNTEERKKDE